MLWAMTSESTPSPESSNFTIRPARRRDLSQLVKLIEPFVENQKLLPRTREELVELLPHGFVAVTKRKIVGFAALEVYSKKMAEIRSLAVQQEFQRQGIGQLLVDACVKRARERRILEVMAVTSADRFFRSCGFDFTLPGEKKAFFFQTRDIY